jgi:hypothetical protein
MKSLPLRQTAPLTPAKVADSPQNWGAGGADLVAGELIPENLPMKAPPTGRMYGLLRESYA